MSGPVAKPRHRFWMLWSLAPFGLGGWVPLDAGLKARRRSWVALGVVFCAPALAGWTLSGILDDDVEVGLVAIPWLAAVVTTAAIYPAYRREAGRDRGARAQRVGPGGRAAAAPGGDRPARARA